jgi:hypothetical protein
MLHREFIRDHERPIKAGTELICSLLDVFARFLPDLKATFSIFDQPQIYLSWARRESLVNLGLHGDRELPSGRRPGCQH